jgi:hypothetical protein
MAGSVSVAKVGFQAFLRLNLVVSPRNPSEWDGVAEVSEHF